MMKGFCFCIALMLIVMSCQPQTSKIAKVDKVFLEQEVLGKKAQLIDVRTPVEYDSGHIEGAVNYNIIDSETFLSQISVLDKNQPVYVYCKMGGRSNRAAQLLKEHGF